MTPGKKYHATEYVPSKHITPVISHAGDTDLLK